MPFTIVRQDITKMKVDAIVNAANTSLLMGGGVCGAIFKAAGPQKLQAACDKLAPIKTGEAVLTPGFALRARYVIHTAGPVYSDKNRVQNEAELRAAYRNSLELAKEHRCNSIAFPLISSGIYGYPKDEALTVATDTIAAFLEDNDMDVYLAVFDKASFTVSEELMGEVESYIDEHYVDKHLIKRRSAFERAEDADFMSEAPMAAHSMLEEPMAAPPMAKSPKLYGKVAASLCKKPSLDDLISDLDEPFSDTLFRLIDRKGKTDVEVYKKANIDRKLFSKIRSVKGYTPKKPTILALAVALELSLEETDDLLERAGYALSHANKFDVIVEYFIVNGRYNIFDINQVLFQYDQPLLGGV